MLMVILWTRPLNVLGSVHLSLLSLPPLFLSPCYFRPSYGGSGGRSGLAGGGNRDNKGFKTLRAAYSKAAFQAARSQAASTEPSVPAASAMTEGWQNNHLNNVAESLTPQ